MQNLGSYTEANKLIEDENSVQEKQDEVQQTTQEAAVKHLYSSIAILDPNSSEIDAKILKKVTDDSDPRYTDLNFISK